MEELIQKGKLAKAAAAKLATASSDTKRIALVCAATALVAHTNYILEENKKDIDAGRANGMSDGLIDRLLLTPERINSIADGIRQIADLPDPIGEVLSEVKRPNGLSIGQMRVPLGVCGIIYEARPNVTADAAALCIKSGNACILRCGKEAHKSSMAITKVIQDAIFAAGIPKDSV